MALINSNNLFMNCPLNTPFPSRIQKNPFDNHFGGTPFFDDDFFRDAQLHFEKTVNEFRQNFDNFKSPQENFNGPTFCRNFQEHRQDASLTEDEHCHKVILDVKGFMYDDLEVKMIDENVLQVEGSNQQQQDSRSSSASFSRVFNLPGLIEADAVTSTVSSDGILTVIVPKSKGIEQENNIVSTLSLPSNKYQEDLLESESGKFPQQYSPEDNIQRKCNRLQLANTEDTPEEFSVASIKNKCQDSIGADIQIEREESPVANIQNKYDDTPVGNIRNNYEELPVPYTQSTCKKSPVANIPKKCKKSPVANIRNKCKKLVDNQNKSKKASVANSQDKLDGSPIIGIIKRNDNKNKTNKSVRFALPCDPDDLDISDTIVASIQTNSDESPVANIQNINEESSGAKTQNRYESPVANISSEELPVANEQNKWDESTVTNIENINDDVFYTPVTYETFNDEIISNAKEEYDNTMQKAQNQWDELYGKSL